MIRSSVCLHGYGACGVMAKGAGTQRFEFEEQRHFLVVRQVLLVSRVIGRVVGRVAIDVAIGYVDVDLEIRALGGGGNDRHGEKEYTDRRRRAL